jgi:hypothetical protein
MTYCYYEMSWSHTWVFLGTKSLVGDEISKRSVNKHDLARFMRANERVVWGTTNRPY